MKYTDGDNVIVDGKPCTILEYNKRYDDYVVQFGNGDKKAAKEADISTPHKA